MRVESHTRFVNVLYSVFHFQRSYDGQNGNSMC